MCLSSHCGKMSSFFSFSLFALFHQDLTLELDCGISCLKDLTKTISNVSVTREQL